VPFFKTSRPWLSCSRVPRLWASASVPLPNGDSVLQSQVPCPLQPKSWAQRQLQTHPTQQLQLQWGIGKEQAVALPFGREAPNQTQQHSWVVEGMRSWSTHTLLDAEHQLDICNRHIVSQEAMQSQRRRSSATSPSQPTHISVQSCCHAASTPASPLMRTRCTAVDQRC